MKNLKFLVAAVMITSMIGSAALAADVSGTSTITTPVIKNDTKADVKTPVKKHIQHKKAPVKKEVVRTDSTLDTSKSDSSVK